MPKNESACDICGRTIFGKPKYKFIEGAKLLVCQSCSKFGTSTKTPRSIKPTIIKRKKRSYRRYQYKDDFFLIEEFGKTIKEARERKGQTQNELARILKEPLSLIKRIEQNKINPSLKIIKKIENQLNITLTEKNIEEDFPRTRKISKKPTTIGDIAQIKKKEK